MMGERKGDCYLDRVVRILEAFGPGDRSLGVSDIARRSGLHIATASRIAASLVDSGLLERDPDRRLRVGLRLWELGVRASPALELRSAALPVMEDLHTVVRQHVQLSVREGEEVLFLDRLSAPGAVSPFSRIAGRLPLHASSSGQVLLAYGPRDLQSKFLTTPLRGYTAHTITDARRLRVTLSDIRRRGYSRCLGHLDEGAQSIAVPINVPRTGVVASLSVVLPADIPDASGALLPALHSAARAISRSLTPAEREIEPVG
ncbi:IclR family transcriptional regulator domain-containing protein [Nocardia sp. R7R-8]|uniref:IclR family transcriptional regulator domain-containing protein n=1 Tax=Nocardia sp. R7R-8 TaxID=3459304 RepID=UPI00403E2F93